MLGGSVAQQFGDNILLKNLFEDLIPGIKFDIINCGMSAYDSYRELLVQKEVLKLNPDLIILMSGNNEYFIPVKINPLAYRLNRLLRRLWIYRDSQERFITWSKNQEIYSTISREYRLKNFENNLRTMIRRAKKKKIPMVLCTLPANFSDCPPTGMPKWQDKRFFLGRYALDNKELDEAIKRFQEFIVVHPEDAFGHYFLAKCYEYLKEYSLAQSHYLKALELDAAPGDRTPPQRNEVIRRLCAEEDVILADLEKNFIKVDPNGLLGRQIFMDSCHWWPEYNYLVSQEIISSINEYNITHLRKIFASLDRFYDLSLSIDPVFLETNTQEKAFKKLLYSISELLRNPTNLIYERTVFYIEQTYYFDPNYFKDETYLKKEIFKNISSNWWMQSQLPDFDRRWPIFLMHIGEAFRRLKLYPEAVDCFKKALDLNPSLWFAYLGRALARYKLGLIKEAESDFNKAENKTDPHPLIKFYRELLRI